MAQKMSKKCLKNCSKDCPKDCPKNCAKKCHKQCPKHCPRNCPKPNKNENELSTKLSQKKSSQKNCPKKIVPKKLSPIKLSQKNCPKKIVPKIDFKIFFLFFRPIKMISKTNTTSQKWKNENHSSAILQSFSPVCEIPMIMILEPMICTQLQWEYIFAQKTVLEKYSFLIQPSLLKSDFQSQSMSKSISIF